MKRWKINKADEEVVKQILQRTDLPEICAHIMAARGISDIQELSDFFNEADLSDPFDILDMDKAVEAISSAAEEGQLICVYGDYDCDGVTATVILYNYLECMGANVMYYIPEREDGYGLNCKAVDMLADMGVKLIVTVDNGISAAKEAGYIYEKGMKLVVTDHHQPPEGLPQAEALVNPHRADCGSEYKDLSGAGVALKLCAALDDGNYEAVMEQYADLAAMGTVADIVPLDGENRTIVSKGLMLMKNSENHGINYLMERCSITPEKLDSASIAFGIAPRINAAGRMGSALTAAKVLLEEGEDAEIYVDTLISLNDERRNVENRIVGDIKEYIADHPEELDQRVVILCGKGWHHGVIGIASSKILDIYGKPNIIISVDENGEARGSARSIKGFHIHKCLTYCADLLEKFGGHECAGGFSLKEEDIPEFCRRVQEYAKETCPDMPQVTITADKLLRGREINIENARALKMLEPFGEGNECPVFAILGAAITAIHPLSQGKHTKLELEYDGVRFPALLFSEATAEFPFKVGERLDLLVTMEVNVYGGRESISIKAVDRRLSGIRQEPYFAAKSSYEKLMLKEKLPDNYMAKVVPERNDLVLLFRAVKAVGTVSSDVLFMRLGEKMNYCKMRLCIDVLCELEILEYDAVSSTVSLKDDSGKRELTDSKLFVKLRETVGQ